MAVSDPLRNVASIRLSDVPIAPTCHRTEQWIFTAPPGGNRAAPLDPERKIAAQEPSIVEKSRQRKINDPAPHLHGDLVGLVMRPQPCRIASSLGEVGSQRDLPQRSTAIPCGECLLLERQG